MTRYAKYSTVFLLIVGFGLGASAQANEVKNASGSSVVRDPIAFVTGVGTQAVSLLGREEGVDAQSWRTLQELVLGAADVSHLSRHALGRHWQRATSDQRQAFQTLFVDYLLDRLSGFLGAAGVADFDVVGSSRTGSGETTVVSRMGTRSAGDINVVWLVRDTEHGYRIADLTMSGISVAAMSRGEISAVANRQGVPGLIRLLQRRMAARDALR